MKRFCLLLCCILMIQVLCGACTKKEELQEPVNFYYCNAEVSYNSSTGVLCPEVREGMTFRGNIVALLGAYLSGPHDTGLQSPIPNDVYLISCELDEDTVNILLSTQFAKLSGLDLTTACSALLLTVHDYTGVQTLCVSAKNAKVDDKDIFVLTMEDIVLMDAVTNTK